MDNKTNIYIEEELATPLPPITPTTLSTESQTEIPTTPKCCKHISNKMGCYNWLQDIPEALTDTDMVEVQFKNTRKGYYKNSNNIPLEKGDFVAVESSPGHDIGEVTLIGKLVLLQMKKANNRIAKEDIKRIYRKVKQGDMEKYEEAKSKEQGTMLRARQIAQELNLNMKIGDVEYQGDGNKAIFYYIADDRVDFRQLIKVLADAFRVRIEMKQIGARQEAGRIGGVGPCGRPLCCSSFITNFSSVSTSAARIQDMSLNPQKLAGQCAKLKCCINYEVDIYSEAQKKLPSREITLETKDNTYYHFKTDIFRGLITYSTSKEFAANVVTIDAQRAFEILAMNKKGLRPDELAIAVEPVVERKEFEDVVGQDSLTRFDKSQKSNNNGNNNNGNNRNGNRNNARRIDNNSERNTEKKIEIRKVGNINQPERKDNKANNTTNNEPRENRERQNRDNKKEPRKLVLIKKPKIEDETTTNNL